MAAPLSNTGAGAGPACSWGDLRPIGSPDQWREAGPEDAVVGVQPRMIFEPRNETEVATALRVADNAGLSVIPRGGGTKTAWGNPPARADLILSTVRMNQVIEHAWADLTASVESGCTIGTLQNALAQHGQQIAVDPLWPEQATIGGILSANDTGTLRIRYGGLRDLIIGVTIALPDGTLASSGGKVVKNVAGYDLPKLTTGALGTLGVIARAIFRLHPLPSGRRTISFSATSVDEMQRQILAIQDAKLAHTALQIRGDSEGRFAADILFEGTEAGLAAEESQLLTLVGGSALRQSAEFVWGARQNLWPPPPVNAVVAKLCVLPSAIATTIHSVKRIADPRNLHFQYVVQATGIGTLRVEGDAKACKPAIEQIRAELERSRSSLVVLHQPLGLEPLEAWGSAGDAISLMRAVKYQLDPKNILNPGRFVRGI